RWRRRWWWWRRWWRWWWWRWSFHARRSNRTQTLHPHQRKVRANLRENKRVHLAVVLDGEQKRRKRSRTGPTHPHEPPRRPVALSSIGSVVHPFDGGGRLKMAADDRA